MNRREIQIHGYDIAEEYDGNLTVRQLYYQFVGRGLVNPQLISDKQGADRFYKRVVAALTAARMNGDFPFDWLVDRMRTCEESQAFADFTEVDMALDDIAEKISEAEKWAVYRDRWLGQKTYVLVGVEKDALSGVLQEPCEQLGVGLFVFRGYASVSSLYELCLNLQRAYLESSAEEAVLLYLGDHDPDGWEIPRSALRNIRRIIELEGLSMPSFRVERIALNMDQVQRYDPPPFPAKVSSSRYEGYIEEHGIDDAWELDALRPDVLKQLLVDNVEAYFDPTIHMENIRSVRFARRQVRDQMREPGWIEDVLS